MKIIRTIFDRPYLLIFITAIIALIFPDRYFLNAIGLIGIIFIISIVYTITQKKWLRLLFSILGFLTFFVVWLGFLFYKEFADELKPIVELGDSNFYKNEIEKSSNLKIQPSLKIISKLDTILYVGIEKEYDAECLYSGPSKLIIELENEIISQKEFSKVDKLEKYPTEVLTQDNFNLKELKSVYKKESQGSYIIYIAFNKSNSKIYYSALYY